MLGGEFQASQIAHASSMAHGRAFLEFCRSRTGCADRPDCAIGGIAAQLMAFGELD